MSRMFVRRGDKALDIVVRERDPRTVLAAVDLVWVDDGVEHRELLCQVAESKKLGWTVVVSGEVEGLRMVEGFKTRWQSIEYALNVRSDMRRKGDSLHVD